MIEQVNYGLRGWANYYAHTHASDAFDKLQAYATRRLRRHLRRRRQRSGLGRYKEMPDRFLYEKLGLVCRSGGCDEDRSVRARVVGCADSGVPLGPQGARFSGCPRSSPFIAAAASPTADSRARTTSSVCSSGSPTGSSTRTTSRQERCFGVRRWHHERTEDGGAVPRNRGSRIVS